MNALLRSQLRAKARLGRYDPRMLEHYPTAAGRVNKHVQAFIARGFAAGLVPAWTTQGQHAANSYHSPVNGIGRAADLGLVEKEIGTEKGRRRMVRFQRKEHERFVLGKAPAMQELIGPDNNAIVLRGARTHLVEGTDLENMHDNHVHGAFV